MAEHEVKKRSERSSSLWRNVAGVLGVLILLMWLFDLSSTLAIIGGTSSGYTFGYLAGSLIHLALGLWLLYYSVKGPKKALNTPLSPEGSELLESKLHIVRQGFIKINNVTPSDETLKNLPETALKRYYDAGLEGTQNK